MKETPTSTSEPSVPREELLEYLLYRCDTNAHHHLRLGFPFQVLGYAALDHDESRLREYQDIHLPCYSPFVRLQTYQRLFTEALAGLKDRPLKAIGYPTLPDYPGSIRRGISKKFLIEALQDGRDMLDRNDSRFLSVFFLVSWLGLRFDRGAQEEFQNRCISSDGEPQERITVGLGILKGALGPRAER